MSVQGDASDEGNGNESDGSHPGAAPDGDRTKGEPEEGEDEAQPSVGSLGDAYSVFNVLVGTNILQGPNLGITSASDTSASDQRSMTGTVTDRQVSVVASTWVETDSDEDLLGNLKLSHLVVLYSRRGTGKRSAAIWALSQIRPDKQIISLSPISSCERVARREFKDGLMYVLFDHTPENGTSSYSDFALELIAERLKAAGCFMVITLQEPEAPIHLQTSFFRPWRGPDTGAIVARRARDRSLNVDDRDHSRLLQAAEKLRGPAEVLKLVDDVAEFGIEEAIDRLSSGGRARVRHWIERQPHAEEVFLVAAVAFLNEIDVDRFDGLYRPLESELHETYSIVQRFDQPLGQSKRSFHREDGLIEESIEGRQGPTMGYEAVYRLRSIVSIGDVLEQLKSFYRGELWAPLERWIDGLSSSADPEAQIRVARAVAEMWKLRPISVERQTLVPWARDGGLASDSAAFVLWWLGFDESTAAAAFAYAESWIRNGNVSQRRTGIRSLGGELGARFANEAITRLWMSAQADPSPTAVLFAREAIANLWLASTLSSQKGSPVLSYVVRRLRILTTEDEGNYRKLNRALQAAEVMITSREVTSELLIADIVARADRSAIPLLASMWSHLLTNRPTRTSSVAALMETLESLSRTEAQRVDMLGTSIIERLSQEERQLLKRDLTDEWLSGTPDKTKRTAVLRDLVRAM